MTRMCKSIKLSHSLKRVLLALCTCVCILNANAVTYQLGDLAPRGDPDGQLNAGDLVVMQRLVLGVIAPTANELIIGDVVNSWDDLTKNKQRYSC